ncbi:phage virion morphogenesis protein [Xanthobacter sp. 126]|uniref:phage virion morphogenesis protein n=1 Tax=Xanthobacter sp. 126 TaxID=1131814 RepID=UPI00045E65AD|nr:phage virion morphogenesis protein [Xanthobacter sp. 126]
MAGIRLVVELDNVVPEAVMSRLAGADFEPLLTIIGAVLESSTRERIEETKTAPDGTRWAPNREGTSTLLRTGRHLRDSIAFIASASELDVGSSWEFAHIHQDGAVIKPKNAKRLSFVVGGHRVSAKQVTIPARPFVGVSKEDEAEILRVATDYLRTLVGGAP